MNFPGGMNYHGAIYRPPVEANTFLLPITEGCTHNSCSFCNMYQEIPFRMLPLTEVEEYLQEVKRTTASIAAASNGFICIAQISLHSLPCFSMLLMVL